MTASTSIAAATSPEQITEATLASFAATPDPRLREITQSLTRHLHAFVSEVAPSQDEWAAAIGFLTRVGHMCRGPRQEFILLSDVLGVSMLVDALGHEGGDDATESTVLGPFYVDEPPVVAQGSDIASGSSGTRMWIDIQVADEFGVPLEGATVDIWQCDVDGLYDVQRGGDAKLDLRARFVADREGRVRCWSVVPVAYQIPSDGPVGDLLAATGRHPWRPAHVHFKIACDGYVPLVTHLFVRGDDYLESDAVFGVKPSLIVELPYYTLDRDAAEPSGSEPWRSLEYGFVLRSI
jgi:hydroxyquinol 1,2-dioxygenase